MGDTPSVIDVSDDHKLWRVLGRIESTMVDHYNAIERIGNSLSEHVKGCNKTNLTNTSEAASVRSAVEAQGLGIAELKEAVDRLVPVVAASERTRTNVTWFGKNIIERIVYVIVGAGVVWMLSVFDLLPKALVV